MNEGCRLYTQRTEQGAVVVYLNNNHICIQSDKWLLCVMAQHITQNHSSLNSLSGKSDWGGFTTLAKGIKPILGLPSPSTSSTSISNCHKWNLSLAIVCGDETFDLTVLLT